MYISRRMSLRLGMNRLLTLTFLLLVVLRSTCIHIVHAISNEREVYIVYLGSLSPDMVDHLDMLRDIVDARFMKKNLLRSYKRSFNGFVASLTAQEHEKLAGHEKVLSIFPNAIFHTQTTRSWDFMGFPMNIPRNLAMERACKGGENFTCNNKLIGARFYTTYSARDDTGHGSHTASTAAGRPIDASFYGIAGGVARGGVPSARIAIYKACRDGHCETANILSAFDDAISDGVDIISASIGLKFASDLASDGVAIGGFHASVRGILVVQSAGNEARKSSTASIAPWVFSVAASNTDRGIITKVSLEDGTTYNGKSIHPFNLHGISFPIVYGDDSRCHKEAAKACDYGCLEPNLVKGKIVMCNNYSGIEEVSKAGALGAILQSSYPAPVSFVVPTAASSFNESNFNTIQSYFSSTKSPKATILPSELITNLDAPRVAGFSSRGPNIIIPDILKPDITAPGVEILAAYSPLASPSGEDDPYDSRSVDFNVMSGTSVACPHVTAAAAYIKSFHTDWSASAIKSALMTTSWRLDPTKDKLAEFSYGAGHIDPRRAVDPGLMYETSTEDYLTLVCNLGYARLLSINGSCAAGQRSTAPKDMNYPSMTARVNGSSFSENFVRTVTNVGEIRNMR
ncbi:hypothetical protein ACP275_12G088700 [Erythranthe tilingii]